MEHTTQAGTLLWQRIKNWFCNAFAIYDESEDHPFDPWADWDEWETLTP